MKVNILDLKGKSKAQVELPKVFSQKIRSDLIKRSFLSFQSLIRQPYGSDPMAGKRTSAHYHGRRHIRYSMMMISRARLPRLHGSGQLSFRVRRVPQSVKGRRAHPPKTVKDWVQKINKKENLLAFKSAFAATASFDCVKERGHLVDGIKLPLVIEDNINSIKKTKDVLDLLLNLGLSKELERTKEMKVRKGRGKMRGRKYKKKVGPLLVVTKDDGILKSGKNISGVDVKLLDELTIKDLAPGSNPGRLTIYSQSALKSLEGFENGSI